MTSPERRQAIVDAAVDLFAKRGFRGTTTRELAGAVGVSEPTLYQHFKTKSELYTAILESHCDCGPKDMEAHLAPLIEAEDDWGLFTALGEAMLGWYLDDARYPRLLLYSCLEGHELKELVYETHVVAFYRMLSGYIERRMEKGVFRQMDPMLAARAFAGMFAHLGMIGSVYCPPGEPELDRKAAAEALVGVFLRGIKL
jgi:AcrR family transcriptional regulator